MSNVFGRFSIFFFSLCFPLLMFLTLFRFTEGTYSIYGFQDLFNGLSFVNTIDLREDIVAIQKAFKELQVINEDISGSLSLPMAVMESIDNLDIPSSAAAILKVVMFIATMVKDFGSLTLYFINGVNFILTLIDTLLVLLLDFIPFAVNLLDYFINALTENVYNLLGDYSNFGNGSFESHLDWFEGLTSNIA